MTLEPTLPRAVVFDLDGALIDSRGDIAAACNHVLVWAGLDLALAMVERDFGHALSTLIARHLVLFIRRAGGQSQFSPHLQSAKAHTPSLQELHGFISEHPRDQLDVPSLAKRAGMSVRHFSRRFRTETGVSPAAYIERVRLEHARALLETSDHGIDAVAALAGFGHAETLRRVFARRIGVSPREYRARFSRRAQSTTPASQRGTQA